MQKINIYLDDVRTPVEAGNPSWMVVRNYEEFVSLVEKTGLENIDMISLDHDLGPESMKEYFDNVSKNYKLEYEHIKEKTGYDCAKWLVNYFYDKNPERIDMTRVNKKLKDFLFPRVVVHSANPIGSANIMGYINNFLMNEGQNQNCIRMFWEHTTADW
jgi:hypothetical protein